MNKVEIGANGITLSNREGVPSNCVFMTDGTTQELISITPDELNEILVWEFEIKQDWLHYGQRLKL